jgi:hypothetical protein
MTRSFFLFFVFFGVTSRAARKAQEDRTCVYGAVQGSHLSCVQFLVEKGATVDARDKVEQMRMGWSSCAVVVRWFENYGWIWLLNHPPVLIFAGFIRC